jgi:hypothetical protein
MVLTFSTESFRLSESEPHHFTNDYHVKQEVGGTRANSQIDTPK